MPRQDPFARFRDNPQDTVSAIPQARAQKRNRFWDQNHPVITYYVPDPLYNKGREIRSAILGLSHKYGTNISCVASALVSYSLAMAEQGRLKVEARPDAVRCKMALTWEEVNDRPQEIPEPQKRASSGKDIHLYLAYRWSPEVDSQIRTLAGDVLAVGEMVVFLLNYALEAFRQGRLHFREEAVVMSQKVSPKW